MKPTMTIPALSACLLVIAPATASAVGERVRVCADTVEFNREPNQGRDGVLVKGESFGVRKLSGSGKYAYGFAYGNINRTGWVFAADLCETAMGSKKVTFGDKPYLVATSNGAYVDYTLTRNAAEHSVTIDGAKARTLKDGDAAGEYRAIITRPSLENGRSYTVRIRVARRGTDLVRTQRLYLHRGGYSE